MNNMLNHSPNPKIVPKFHTMSYTTNCIKIDIFEGEWVKKKKIEYLNMPIAFDIETSSFYKDDEKQATMYIWQLSIGFNVIYGRTWAEFIECMSHITNILSLSESRRVIIYVHNLAYEFQFMRKMFEWIEMTANNIRKPIKATTINGVEFRCSYLLSGYNLEYLAQSLEIYDIKKQVGMLDYDLIRHSETHITKNELMYCIYDVIVVVCYIYETMLKDGDITKIPLTKTGYVRRYCRNNTIINKDKRKAYKYRNLIKNLRINNSVEYMMLKQAFQGGFTHSNPFMVCKSIDNVHSYDFTSSYPSVMVTELYPMSTGQFIDTNDIEKIKVSLKKYCCVMTVTINNIKSSLLNEYYISHSRCIKSVNPILFNGRIESANSITITITNIDLNIINQVYKYSDITFHKLIRYRKSYLPTTLIESILDLYKDKTTLKGDETQITKYNQSKAMLNSVYGMAVTDIIKDEITYTNEWAVASVNIDEKIQEYNDNKSRFLFYPWGIFVTAYARYNLWTAIINIKDDYIYSDTDSIKFINLDKHEAYFNEYNKQLFAKLHKAMAYHKLDIKSVAPVNNKGHIKMIGAWDYEGCYVHFKTLGAKRYIYGDDYDFNITVSGLNKKVTVPYIKSVCNNPYDFFNDGLAIPAGFTGKLTHTYIDVYISGEIVDYTGSKAHYSELSSVHLESAPYEMTLSNAFNEFIRGLI